MKSTSARLRAFIRQNVIGFLALYVALGAVAWAAGVGPRDIRADAVRSKHIKDGQVKAGDVAASAVQLRVWGECPAGASVRAVDEDGGVSCEVDDVGPGGEGAPSGPAGGDLTGTYPNPTLAAGSVAGGPGGVVQDNSLTGADISEPSLDFATVQRRLSSGCSSGHAISSISQAGVPTCVGLGGPPSGPAGGDLTGSYPNPALATGAVAGGPGGEIQDGTVTKEDVKNGSLTGADIEDNTINADDVFGLGSADITDNSLTGADISNVGYADLTSVYDRFAERTIGDGTGQNGHYNTEDVTVYCDPGDLALSGGTFWVSDEESDVELTTVHSYMWNRLRDGELFKEGWTARGGNDSGGFVVFRVQVRCLKV